MNSKIKGLLDGASSLFDYTLESYNLGINSTYIQDDNEAIQNDWIEVGKDIVSGVVEYEHKKS